MTLGLYVNFVVIFKNTKNIILSATLGDFGVFRWENYTAATIRLTDFSYDSDLIWSFILSYQYIGLKADFLKPFLILDLLNGFR